MGEFQERGLGTTGVGDGEGHDVQSLGFDRCGVDVRFIAVVKYVVWNGIYSTQ